MGRVEVRYPLLKLINWASGLNSGMSEGDNEITDQFTTGFDWHH